MLGVLPLTKEIFAQPSRSLLKILIRCECVSEADFIRLTSDHDFTTTLCLSMLLWRFCFGKFYNLFSTTVELNVENPPSHAISV